MEVKLKCDECDTVDTQEPPPSQSNPHHNKCHNVLKMLRPFHKLRALQFRHQLMELIPERLLRFITHLFLCDISPSLRNPDKHLPDCSTAAELFSLSDS